ncbi:MAG: TonB-dependent receptor, partial [Bryobacteraceae bacterium]
MAAPKGGPEALVRWFGRGISTLLAVTVMAVLFLSTAIAQSTFGSFVGTVKDSSGAVVADCVVTLTNTGTSATRTTITDKDGNYVLINIDAGAYSISMQAPGFQVANFPSLNLMSRQTVRIDGTLGVAQQVETVNVSASSESVITTEVSSIAETKTGRELLDLPVAIGSRAAGSTSPISTLTTQAGVQVDNAGGLSVAGSKPSMLSVTVDGISTMSVRTNAAAAELFPSFGTIAEIRVSEINNAAEFGGVSDITTVSKSGSNSFHGGVYENLQNTSLNARNPFAAARSKTIMNNYGGFVGGPVIKDKTFFFASYEALKLPRQQFINQSVPSVALRNGDLSAYSGTIKDPLTGVPFTNNQIPLNRISPVALNALQYLFPLPNTGAPNAIANNYSLNLPVPISSHQGDLRIDQNISSRQTAFMRLTYKDRDVASPPTSAQSVTTTVGAAYQPERDMTIAAAHNFVVTPRIVNELRVGLSDVYILTSTDANAADLVKKIGVAVPDPPGGSATPNFVINGFQNTTTAASSISRSKTIQLLDNVSVNAGAHTYKFGGDIRMLSAYFSNVFATTRVGAYTYNGSITNSIIGNPYAAFLLGVPDRTQVSSVLNPDSNGHSTHYAFYAQDDWKVTSRLTINYGLRWEYHPPFTDKLANIAVFLPDYYSVVNGVGVRGAVAVADAGMNQVHPLF